MSANQYDRNLMEREIDRRWRSTEDVVARYTKDHKEATRRRIVAAAGPRFKADGFDGSGVATLMADAGLTNGAFYAHFDSKDDLIAAVVADQLASQRATLRAVAADRAGVAQFVRGYLAPEHIGDRAEGCPSAALLDEIGRSAGSTRAAYTEGVSAIIEDISAVLAPNDPESVRGRVAVAMSLMFGTVQLARALTDAAMADRLLAESVPTVLEILGLAYAGSAAPSAGGKPKAVTRSGSPNAVIAEMPSAPAVRTTMPYGR